LPHLISASSVIGHIMIIIFTFLISVDTLIGLNCVSDAQLLIANKLIIQIVYCTTVCSVSEYCCDRMIFC